MVSRMVQSDYNGTRNHFFVQQKCCLVKQAYMFFDHCCDSNFETLSAAGISDTKDSSLLGFSPWTA